ncbi:hypothetical protein [Vibrio sp. D431a]|uniref:hypothetical protein n=1 Tax=Vibrio sp. D431a TaxID=2837388 RepID=UPI002556AE67|nr:hypothetical protein [Vibrio sp. D431a]MDK9793849.1 hypothetical protein [Vibrio sp. D431a]
MKRVSILALLTVLSGGAKATDMCFGVTINPYKETLNGQPLVHDLLDKKETCIYDFLKENSQSVNPYFHDKDGVTVVEKLLTQEKLSLVSQYRSYLDDNELTHLDDLVILSKLRLKDVDFLKTLFVQDFMFSRYYETARFILDATPSTSVKIDKEGFSVPQSLVESLKFDDHNLIAKFKDLDFNLYSNEIGVTPMQMLCRKDYIKSLTYLVSEGVSPFEQNLYGSDTINTINKNAPRYCGALINTIVYGLKNKQ